MNQPIQFPETIHQVTSADGTVIGYRQMGSGPGLIILHGGGRASKHYLGLAESLAGAYTVYIPDRRGRGLSGPDGENYNLTKVCEDISALIDATQAHLLFGHSAGAIYALEAALTMPIQALMLYDPPVSIQGSIPTDWLAGFERSLVKNDPATAMAIFLRALQMNWMSSLPQWALAPFFRLMLRGAEGAEIVGLLHTVIPEFRMVEPLESKHERYRNISARTLLIGGSKSPAFLRDVLPVLAQTIPQATRVELPGLDHSAPEEDGAPMIARLMLQFLAKESIDIKVA